MWDLGLQKAKFFPEAWRIPDPRLPKIELLPVECRLGPDYNAGRFHRKYK
jgi:hypothetical protein